MTINVELATTATETLLDGLNHLLPQLSSTAASLTLTDLELLVRSDAVKLLIAMEGDAVVGTLTLITFPIPTGRRAWIEDVVVDVEARGRGVGEALTTAAIDVAIGQGVRTIDLTSRPSREAANALYVKLGFEHRETNVYRLSL
jgi:ribosomal protein S18 acetylase RimI-like enzyme